MNRTKEARLRVAIAALFGLALAGAACADDTPAPCAALKRIVAAAPSGFTSLDSQEVSGVARPYGDDVQCSGAQRSFQCRWTPHGDAGSSTDALQGVAADIASCLPDATHDQNTPARQHFYIGARGARTEVTATTAGSNQLRLVVSRP